MNRQKSLYETSFALSRAQEKLAFYLNGGRTSWLEEAQTEVEKAVLALYALRESVQARPEEPRGKPPIPPSKVVGDIEVNYKGCAQKTNHTLLPHCRSKTPAFLQQALYRLMEQYQQNRGKLPCFEKALLVIDEHCNIDNRQIYDQDNKGYKAIPNAIKRILVPDDDQFTLSLALLSTLDEQPSCHIYVLPAEEASEFFALRDGQYGIFL